ncbi:hypothetical protein [Methanoculleus thermophilus]|uniref:Uncharacterized protein n=1 Tax=Methanoculleus thermophilus TaxID=2200 RepID=A0A1G9AU50_9EURY|nr:hypothetical protein [Methanoculleus thermophilus]SDK30811.1 hypothetical protein SAMN04488571_10731 [Methanoculleus thermophilus]
MKISKKHIIYILALILAISAAVLLIPLYYNAYFNRWDDCGITPASTSDLQNEERARIAAKLWEQNISVGEYLEQVFPEIFDSLPEESKEQYYIKPMNWPDLREGDNRGWYPSLPQPLIL